MALEWRWERASKDFANFGNAAHWAISEGMDVLARETTQNSSDALLADHRGQIDYTLIRLTGQEKAEFEAAVGWATLSERLHAMADAPEAVMAGPLKAHLQSYESAEDLLLLRIDDWNATGLTGPEFPDDSVANSEFGNFIKLLRTDLFSGKAEGAGGSYGLGKSVYWAYSRFRTAIFCSQPADGEAGYRRLLGVSQGLDHRLHGIRYKGRGYLGGAENLEPDASISSVLLPDDALEPLHVAREGDRTGTSVLIIGFHDPEDPTASADTLMDGLRDGILSNFWPLLARDRVDLSLSKVENGVRTPRPLNPTGLFPELVDSLAVLDGDRPASDTLSVAGDVVIRDIAITIPRRKTGDKHGSFVHTAKLVVTLADEDPDPLEDGVCLFRRPEMVVEVLRKRYPGKAYHAFLAAGVAVNPSAPTEEDRWADDFLRFAEPPSHDQWIPSGRRGAPQENLRNNYFQPFVQNLEKIRTDVFAELDALFNAPPPKSPNGPMAVAKHLRFLSKGPVPPPQVRKPVLTINEGAFDPTIGAWVLDIGVDAAVRSEGWSFVPQVVFQGDDRSLIEAPAIVEAVDGCSVDGSRVLLPNTVGRKRLTGFFRLTTRPDEHPMNPAEAAVTVTLKDLGEAL
jgi:hypothetical protein